MTVSAIPYALQNASHPAALFRIATGASFVAGGILATNELPVAQQASPNMTVLLGPGRASIFGNSVSNPSGQNWNTQGPYVAYNDANLTLTIAASNPTNPRIDAVYLQIQDAFFSGSTNTAVAAVATGTPAVSPVAPSIPSNSILLAYVAVAANATTIVTANITYQALRAIPLGTTQWQLTTAAMNALTGAQINDKCYVTATQITYRYNGSAWKEWESDWLGYAPTFANLTLGNGTATGLYKYSGGDGEVLVNVTLGSTSVMSATPTVSMPFTPYGGFQPIGSYIKATKSGVADYPCSGYLSGSTFVPNAVNASGTYDTLTAFSSTVPFSWAGNDSFIVDLSCHLA